MKDRCRRSRRHIKRFTGGRFSPQEFHRKHAFPPNAKCSGCQAKPAIRAIVMMSTEDAERHGMIPMGAGKAPLLFPQLAPVLVPIRDGGTKRLFVRTSLAYSCTRCQKDFEKALAKTPSYCLVDINYGPDPRNRVQLGAT